MGFPNNFEFLTAYKYKCKKASSVYSECVQGLEKKYFK